MPTEALGLALAASIYPPALAVVIALGRGVEVRLRVVLFVIAAYLTVLVTGAIMLAVFGEAEVTRRQATTVGAGLYLLVGGALLFVAARALGPGPPAAGASKRHERTMRFLQSRRLVIVLGVTLYIVPSPIYLGAVHAISETNASAGQQLVYLAEILVLMLWLIEVPMLMLIALPERSLRVLERVNGWFASHGRRLLAVVSAGLGAYLIVVGVVELLT